MTNRADSRRQSPISEDTRIAVSEILRQLASLESTAIGSVICKIESAALIAGDGKTLQDIAAALGHKTLAMVQRYSHLTDSHVHTAMEETGRKVLGDER